MQRTHAINVVNGLLTDYVNMLEKSHPTAARLVQANANAAMRELAIDQSSQEVPGDTDTDRISRARTEA